MLRRIGIGAVLLALAVLPGTGEAHASAPPPHDFGGLDLDAYCRAHGAAAAVATLDGPTAYDWHCRSAPGAPAASLSFTDACRSQYPPGGYAQVVDRIGDFHDPSSVRCWGVHTAQPTSIPDLAAYCADHGHTTAVLLGATVYDWKCADATGSTRQLSDLSLPDVCLWEAGEEFGLDRFRDFNDPYSWECYI